MSTVAARKEQSCTRALTSASDVCVAARLRILATSDVHMHLTNFDYHTGRHVTGMGFSVTSSLIRKARRESMNTLLFDNGDFLQGGLLGEYAALHPVAPHPMIAAMNEIGYDAVNLGNHEFSFGVDYLKSALAEAQFSCVSANTLSVDPNETFVPHSVIIEKEIVTDTGHSEVLRIGVTGVLPPQTEIWEARALKGRLVMQDMLAAVAREAPQLRQKGADIVIVLAHCGIGSATPELCDQHEALAISALPDVDAVVMGHVHQTFPGGQIAPSKGVDPLLGRLNGKPAVMPSMYGAGLGIIDLSLRKAHDGCWTVADHRSIVENIAHCEGSGKMRLTVKPDPAIAAIAKKSHAKMLSWVRRPVAYTRTPLHSYFSMITECSASKVVHKAQIDYVTRRLRGTMWENTPVLSANAPFKAGGRAGVNNYTFIPSGALLLHNAIDLYPHANTLTALHLTGAQIIEWLEHSAQAFSHIPQGTRDAAVTNCARPSSCFDTIHGLSYSINLGADGTGASRLCDVRYNGAALDLEMSFILATNNFRQSGASGYHVAKTAPVVLNDSMLNRDIVISYLAKNGAPPVDCAVTWRFAALPETSVTFDSAPQSRAYLSELTHLNCEPIFITEQGFQRYRLWL